GHRPTRTRPLYVHLDELAQVVVHHAVGDAVRVLLLVGRRGRGHRARGHGRRGGDQRDTLGWTFHYPQHAALSPLGCGLMLDAAPWPVPRRGQSPAEAERARPLWLAVRRLAFRSGLEPA